MWIITVNDQKIKTDHLFDIPSWLINNHTTDFELWNIFQKSKELETAILNAIAGDTQTLVTKEHVLKIIPNYSENVEELTLQFVVYIKIPSVKKKMQISSDSVTVHLLDTDSLVGL